MSQTNREILETCFSMGEMNDLATYAKKLGEEAPEVLVAHIAVSLRRLAIAIERLAAKE